MNCSIVISTYNRAPFLRRLLPGLAHLRGVSFEVVVVNGPSTDDTEAVLASFAGRIKVVRCPTRNVSHSRNLGIAAAAGDIVAFIDDDALPGDVDWLARYVDVFHKDETGWLGAAGGPVLHRDADWLEFKGGATSDYGFQLFDHAECLRFPGQRWQRGVQGCNCAFRRRSLVAIGGFDEFFTYYLDETDVCWRMAGAGYTVEYVPDNQVRHYAHQAVGLEHRTRLADRDWRQVARSDVYFGLKTGRDPWPRRLIKTLRAAPRKNYVGQIWGLWRQGEIPFLRWLQLISQWTGGVLAGLWSGYLCVRQLREFSAAPRDFQPFSPSSVESRLRVALLSQTLPYQPHYGGIGRYTYDLARGLHERGHEVHLICADEVALRRESLGFVVHGIPQLDYQSVRLFKDRPVLSRTAAYGLAVASKLQALYAQGVEFDVVHATNWDAEAAGLIRASVYPVILFLVTPLTQAIKTNQWVFTEDLRACLTLDYWQIARADEVCAPTQGIMTVYEAQMGLSAEVLAGIHRVPLGIVPDAAQPTLRPNGRYRLLFVGRLEPRKGLAALLAVLPELLTAHPTWECHLVGEDRLPLAEGGTFRERFEAQHRGSPWLERVTFHGSLPETALRHQYRECDLFVAPSLSESFGLIYHEAMQYGKAVVGTRTGGVPEVVEQGVEGLLVAPDAPLELRAALEKLMTDHTLRQQMGEAGARRVQQTSNYRAMARQMEQVYSTAIARIGRQRQARRRQVWAREVPLFTASPLARWSGSWKTREAAPGHLYRMGFPGATLEFEASSASVLNLVTLCHEWSGVLEISTDQAVIKYVDLWRPGPPRLALQIRVCLPGEPGQAANVCLRVHSERNPQGFGHEVWLKQVMAFLPQN